MITGARVLQPEFVPNNVVHRDAEINHLVDEADGQNRGRIDRALPDQEQ